MDELEKKLDEIVEATKSISNRVSEVEKKFTDKPVSEKPKEPEVNKELEEYKKSTGQLIIETKELKEEMQKIKMASIITDNDKKKNLLDAKHKFYMAVMDNDKATLRSYTTTTGGASGNGGYYIPEEYSRDVIEMLNTYGKIRGQARIIPMSTDTLNIPEFLGGTTAGWIEEAGSITETAASAGTHTLSAYKIAAYTTATSEFMEDASIAIPFIENDAGRALAYRQDYVCLRADGSADYTNANMTGILSTSTGINTVTSSATAFTGISAADIIDMTCANTLDYQSPVFVFSNTMKQTIRKLQDGDGRYLYLNGMGGLQDTILGFPVIWCAGDTMPTTTETATGTAFGIFGDFRQGLYIGERRGITVAFNPYQGFQNDYVGFRWTMRYDTEVLAPYFTLLKTGS